MIDFGSMMRVAFETEEWKMKDEADGLHMIHILILYTYTEDTILYDELVRRSRLSLSCLLCNADALGLVLYSLPMYGVQRCSVVCNQYG